MEENKENSLDLTLQEKLTLYSVEKKSIVLYLVLYVFTGGLLAWIYMRQWVSTSLLMILGAIIIGLVNTGYYNNFTFFLMSVSGFIALYQFVDGISYNYRLRRKIFTAEELKKLGI